MILYGVLKIIILYIYIYILYVYIYIIQYIYIYYLKYMYLYRYIYIVLSILYYIIYIYMYMNNNVYTHMLNDIHLLFSLILFRWSFWDLPSPSKKNGPKQQSVGVQGLQCNFRILHASTEKLFGHGAGKAARFHLEGIKDLGKQRNWDVQRTNSLR